MISNIQLLRALAAIGVVFFHTQFTLPTGVRTEFQGVNIFFVISGFVMALTLRRNATHFFLRRIIRIVPLYWIVTVATFYYPYFHSNPREDNHEILHSFSFLMESLLFFPYVGVANNIYPFLGVGWTLHLEMLLYALLAVALLISKKRAVPLTALALIAMKLLYAAFTPEMAYFRTYALRYQGYPIGFILGMAAYYLWEYSRRGNLIRLRIPLVTASAFTGAGFLWLNAYGVDTGITITVFLCFIIVLLAVLLEAAGIACRWKPILILGDASYSLYLIHQPWLATQRYFAGQWPLLYPHHATGMCIALATTCLLAVIMHYALEKPVIRLLLAKLNAPGTICAVA